MPAPKPARSSSIAPASSMPRITRAHVIDAHAVFRDARREARRGRRPCHSAAAPVKIRQIAAARRRPPRPRRRRACRSTPLRACIARRADLLGRKTPRPPPSIIAGPPMPMLAAARRDDHVAAAEQRGVAGEAAARDDADQRRRARASGERANVVRSQPGDDRHVGVAGPAAAAFGEQHQRQPVCGRRPRAAGRSSCGRADPACPPAPWRHRRGRRSWRGRVRSGRR